MCRHQHTSHITHSNDTTVTTTTTNSQQQPCLLATTITTKQQKTTKPTITTNQHTGRVRRIIIRRRRITRCENTKKQTHTKKKKKCFLCKCKGTKRSAILRGHRLVHQPLLLLGVRGVRGGGEGGRRAGEGASLVDGHRLGLILVQALLLHHSPGRPNDSQ